MQAPPHGKKIRADKGLNFPDTALNIGVDRERPRRLALLCSMPIWSGTPLYKRPAMSCGWKKNSYAGDTGTSAPAMVLKIETEQAVRHLPDLIVQAARRRPTAVMIERHFAVEIGYNRMAEMQEEMLWLCEAAHVPVIWATQVLENLAKEGVPSRAEVPMPRWPYAPNASCSTKVLLSPKPYSSSTMC